VIKTAAARYVRDARLKAGLTQRALAQRSGVPQPTIAAIESGRQDPRYATLDRLLRAAGFDLDMVRLAGIGVDRTLAAELLKRSPGQRLASVGKEVLALRPFDRAALRMRRGQR
jgi:transcriptional regulator with XRE-family HTH domain